MSVCYLDTSAALKLLIEEKEFEPLAVWLTSHAIDGDSLCSSFLLHTKLHYVARRCSEFDQETIASLLSRINLVDISRLQLVDAARTPLGLRTADATHLAVALSIRADAIITYDIEIQNVARFCSFSPAVPS